MEQYANNLLDQMRTALRIVAQESHSQLQLAEQSLRETEFYLHQLKEYIVNYVFEDVAEEIRFFKQIKPQFQKELFYFLRLYHIESEMPIASKEGQKAYFNRILENASLFFDHNRLMYLYYKTGKTEQDEDLFVRNAKSGLFLQEPSIDIDSRFSTPYSQKLAKIQAYEKICDYAISLIDRIDGQGAIVPSGKEANKDKLFWSANDISIVELAIGLKQSGYVNNGRANLKQIVNQLEETFNVKVGNLYQVAKSIRGRKKERTVALHHLTYSAEKWMDDTDMNF